MIWNFQIGILLVSCNSENAPDCFQNAGEIVRKEVAVPDFSSITVFERVELIIKQGDVQKVEIESGEFLLDEVSAEVEGNSLVLRNENSCNLFREYGLTRIYVTSPNITEIRSSTSYPIASDGVLGYPNLRLLSESFANPEAETTDGAFDLEVDSVTLSLLANGIAYFKLRGQVQGLNITIAAGDSRVDASNLSAGIVDLNHRGTNDILINPQESLRGTIRGTGNVISFNRPPEVAVETIFRGELIFR
ncbi:MAG: head GIN domain-containing protein [Bacteroidota bacterium]